MFELPMFSALKSAKQEMACAWQKNKLISNDVSLKIALGWYNGRYAAFCLIFNGVLSAVVGCVAIKSLLQTSFHYISYLRQTSCTRLEITIVNIYLSESEF